ncbi:MAG: hypothetical protein ACSNEK_00620 [Parachlamydiaceae bacterium]
MSSINSDNSNINYNPLDPSSPYYDPSLEDEKMSILPFFPEEGNEGGDNVSILPISPGNDVSILPISPGDEASISSSTSKVADSENDNEKVGRRRRRSMREQELLQQEILKAQQQGDDEKKLGAKR